MSNQSIQFIQGLLVEQASAPSAPASGQLQLWSKTDNTLHIQNSSAVDAVLAILGAQTFTGLQTFNAGIALSGSNITLNTNHISYGGTAAGLSFDSSNNATFSNSLLSIGGASPNGATTLSQLWAGSGTAFLTLSDSTRTANNHLVDILWSGGTLAIRSVNDAYGAASNLLTFNAGYAGGTGAASFGSNSLTAGAISGTTGAFTGTVSFNNSAATLSKVIGVSGSTTAATYSDWTNTSGSLRIGLDSSVGGVLATGSAPYSTVLGNVSATSCHLITNNAIRITLSSVGGITFPGYTSTSFVAGDKYLVIDASGNIHVSAVGPAS